MTPFNRKSNVLLSTALSVSTFLIYFITPNQIFSFDALTNAIACESNEVVRWFHPNHPLYPFVGVAYFRLERLFGYEGLAIHSLARFNSLLVSAALGVFCYALSRRAGLLTSFVAACFLGASYGVWHFAVDGRAVGAALIFASLLILKLVQIEHKESVAPRDVHHLALLSLLYVLMHGIAIFHAVAVAWWLARHQKQAARHYVAWLVGSLSVTYLAIFFLAIRPHESIDFFRWAIGYASFDASHLPGNTGFWSTSASEGLLWTWFGWKGAFLSNPKMMTAGVLAWSLPATFLLCLGIGAWKFRRALTQNESLVLVFLLWGALSELFIFFWSPGQTGFHLHALIPWTAALAILFQNSKAFVYGQGVIATAMFLWNLTGPISYEAAITHNDGYMAVREIRANLSTGDLFVSARAGTVPDSGVLMPYFFPEIKGGSLEGRLFAFHEKTLMPFDQSLRRRLKEKRGVYLHEDFWDTTVQADLESKHGLTAGALRKFLSTYKRKAAFKLSSGRQVFRIELK